VSYGATHVIVLGENEHSVRHTQATDACLGLQRRAALRQKDQLGILALAPVLAHKPSDDTPWSLTSLVTPTAVLRGIFDFFVPLVVARVAVWSLWGPAHQVAQTVLKRIRHTGQLLPRRASRRFFQRRCYAAALRICYEICCGALQRVGERSEDFQRVTGRAEREGRRILTPPPFEPIGAPASSGAPSSSGGRLCGPRRLRRAHLMVPDRA
jgi:hypothetical protein